jgi:hypothetical protein
MSDARVKQFELDFDRSFIEKWLKFQKGALVFLCLTLLVVLTGVLGRGPLNRQTLSAGPGKLSITYERVLHYKTPSEIEVHLPEQVATGRSEIRLLVSGTLLRGAGMQRILPQPLRAEPLRDGVITDLPVEPLSARGTVLISIEPSRAGVLTSSIGLENGQLIPFRQFVLP